MVKKQKTETAAPDFTQQEFDAAHAENKAFDAAAEVDGSFESLAAHAGDWEQMLVIHATDLPIDLTAHELAQVIGAMPVRVSGLSFLSRRLQALAKPAD